MKIGNLFLLSPLLKWGEFLLSRMILERSFGLKAKITFLIIFIVVGVLFISGYLDFHLSKKAQIDLFLDRNLYIAKQIDIGIPDERRMGNG